MILDSINQELLTLKEKKNYRSLPQLIHDGRDVTVDGRRMLNLSSNDYLGLANEVSLREAFLKTITPETFLPTSSSSRLLTGNFTAYQELEQQLSTMFGAESALLFNSGYHANTCRQRCPYIDPCGQTRTCQPDRRNQIIICQMYPVAAQ